MTPAEQLQTVRQLLTALSQAASAIVAQDPETFAAGELGQSLNRFRAAHEEAVSRLEHPVFRIATIGTTSSGKSTLVNALIGRRLAPIESSEMSAGVLTLAHDERSLLQVDPTEGASWETGQWPDLSDEAIYLRLRAKSQEHGWDGIMAQYRKRRQKDPELPAPRIRIQAPILPIRWDTLRLPESLRFEIIDLPGLKWIQDRQNLKIIQDHVKDAFSLVVLDYGQTDDKNRAALMGELQTVVSAMQGRTDAMLFILNKVDLRTREDQPLDLRLAELSEEIGQNLGLSHPPTLLPISAQLLYSVQCAWGAEVSPMPDKNRRLMFLENCLEDCSKIFRQKRREDAAVKDWLYAHEDDLEALDEGDFKRLLAWAHEWSNGAMLWKTLRQRVSQRFPELVIFPAIHPVLAAWREFGAKAEEVARIRQIKTKERLEQEQTRIQTELDRIQGHIHTRKQDFQTRIRAAADELKKTDPDANIRAINLLGRLPGIESLHETIRQVRLDLVQVLINPLREAFKNNTPVGELQRILEKSLPHYHVRHLLNAYDYYSRRFMSQEAAYTGLVLRAPKGDPHGEKRQRDATDLCRILYQRMREALSHRAGFMLQSRAQEMEGSVKTVLGHEMEQIRQLARTHCPELTETLFPDQDFLKTAQGLELPETLFELPPAQRTEQRVALEKTGLEPFTYETGSCFKTTQTGYRDRFAQVEYQELYLPSADEMAEHWDQGIRLGSDDLWERLADWLKSAFDGILTHHGEALVRASTLFEQTFRTQLQVLEQSGHAEIARWEEHLSRLAAARGIAESLHVRALSQEGCADE